MHATCGQHTRFWYLSHFAQKTPLNHQSDTTRLASGQIFGQSLSLLPYLMYARREGSGETVRMHRLV